MKKLSAFFRPLAVVIVALFLLNICDFAMAQLKSEDLPDREGIKVGEIMLHGAFKVREDLETNIYLSKEKEKFDAITILAPSVGIEIPLKEHNLSADYEAWVFLYGKYNTENHVDHRLRGLAEINFTDFKMRVKDVYRDFTDRAADENSRRIGRQINDLKAWMEAEFDQLGFNVGYTNFVETYSQKDDIVYQSLTYKDKERMSNIVDISVGYRFMPKTSIFVEGDLGFIHYFNSSLPPDAYFINSLLGLKGKPTNKIAANIKGGFKYQHYDHSDILNDKAFFGPVASGGIDYLMTKDDIWYLGVESTLYESDYLNNNYYHANLFNLTYTHKFNRKLSISPFGSYQLNLYPSATTEGDITAKRYDNYFMGGCALRYDIQKWGSAEVKYEYTRKDSRFSTFNYTDNRVTFNGTVGF